MSHWLNDVPLEFSKQPVQELWNILRSSYYRVERVIRFIQDAGLTPADFHLDVSASVLWREVLEKFRLQDRLSTLFDLVKADDAAVGNRIDELIKAKPLVEAPQPAEGNVGVVALAGFTGDERLIVETDNTLLNIAFLQRGLEIARSVCRLTAVWNAGEAHGTAFRISDDLLLTNYHVLHNHQAGWQLANTAEVWFRYERDWDGTLLDPTIISCDLTTVQGEKDHDWAVVKTKQPIPDSFPALTLSKPEAPVEGGDRVNIIQHPKGLTKQIGMVHNLVRAVDENVLQYWTDTMVGSSGSPVFNERWEIVGLHHRAVEIPEEEPTEYRNQGRRIEKILDRMAALGVAV